MTILHYLANTLPSRFSKELSRKYLYESVAAHLGMIAPKSRVLCIGSSGSITDLIKEYSSKNFIRLDLLDNDPSRDPDIIADICCDSLPSGVYDVVLMYEVLEHLYDPFSAINNVYDCLKIGGRLFGSVPFCLPMHETPHDYYRFTEYGLRFLLRNFLDLQIVERGNYYHAIDALWARTLYSRSPLSSRNISIAIVYATFFLKRPISFALNRLNPLSSLCIGYIFMTSKPAVKLEAI